MKLTCLTTLAIAVACSAIIAQDERPPIGEVTARHEDQILGIDGVLRISIGGADKDLRVVVQVETPEAKTAVLALTGEKLEGYKVFILLTPPASSTPRRSPTRTPKPKPKSKAGNTRAELGVRFPETRANPWRAAVQDCNIIRDHLELKRIRHRGDRGLFHVGCQLMKRQVLSGGGGHAYYYTKHWSDCPIRMGRIGEPEWADAFVKWVFQRGFGPVSRGSFLFPFELKGSDRLWVVQVQRDLKTRLKYIRASARWTKTPSEKPGDDWSWEAPKARYPKRTEKTGNRSK